MDLIRHPDLIDVASKMQGTLCSALEAEQIAAQVSYLRQRDLREALLELEDRKLPVRVGTPTRLWPARQIIGVGKDHLVLGPEDSSTLIPLRAIESVTLR